MSSKIDKKSSTLFVYGAINPVMAARQQQLEALSAWVRQQKEDKNYTYEDNDRFVMN